MQNSWGTGTNYDGTLWASSNDAVIGRVGVSTYTLLDNAPHSSTVLQNELGPTAIGEYFPVTFAGPTKDLSIPSGVPTVAHLTAAAVLALASDGELLPLGLFTQLTDVLVDVEISETWDNARGRWRDCSPAWARSRWQAPSARRVARARFRPVPRYRAGVPVATIC